MPQQTQTAVYAKDLSSWTPIVDNRRQGKPGIITGTNFVDDIDGPKSYFANDFNDYNLFDEISRKKISELRLANEILYGTPTGVYRINKTSKLLECLLPMYCANTYWPWTCAYVGAVYYFAQFDVGLWQYDPATETLSHIVTPLGDQIRGVAVSYGRLIYLAVDGNGNEWVGNSDLDDGTALTPSLQTGAGAQSLSMVGGTGLKIVALEGGFFVFTTEGIMQASFTTEAYVFYYRKRSDTIKIFSPNMALYVTGVGVVCLDATGFHNIPNAQNSYELVLPTPWEILMGAFIKDTIFRDINQNLIGAVDMAFSVAEQRLFVSFSSNTREGFMTDTFVYSAVSQKWGSFDIQHYGIFETLQSASKTYVCGFMGVDGYIRKFALTDYTPVIPEPPYAIADYLYRPTLTERAVTFFTDTNGLNFGIGATEINPADHSPVLYAGFSSFGLYQLGYQALIDILNPLADYEVPVASVIMTMVATVELDMDQSTGNLFKAFPYELPKSGLNSMLRLGPFRFVEQVQADETSAVSNLIVGLNQADNFYFTEDYMIGDTIEDYMVGSGVEDYGDASGGFNNYNLTLRDTDDGFNSGIQGDNELYVFDDLGSSQVFVPDGYSSIWHNFTFTATEAGQAFAVKFIDITGQLTGRLAQG